MLSRVGEKASAANLMKFGVLLGVSSLALAATVTSASAETCDTSGSEACAVIISEPLNTDIVVVTDSFQNDSTITLVSNTAGSVIQVEGQSDFSFVNNGTIKMDYAGGRPGAGDVVVNPPEVNWETEELWSSAWPAAIAVRSIADAGASKAAVISNVGIIDGGIAAALNSATVEFRNSGEISALQRDDGRDYAVVLDTGFTFRDSDPGFLVGKYAASSETVLFQNDGIIEGDVSLDLAADHAEFNNTGEITGDVLFNQGYSRNYADRRDSTRGAFNNSGTINGGVELDLEASETVAVNSGSIIAAENTEDAAFSFDTETKGSLSFSFTNTETGIVSDGRVGGNAFHYEGEAEGNPGVTARANIINAGQILANGDGSATSFHQEWTEAVYDEATDTWSNIDRVVDGTMYEVASALLVRTEGGPELPLAVNISNTGTISAEGTYTVAVAVQATELTLVNDGAIIGSNGIHFQPDDYISDDDMFESEEDGSDFRYLAGAIHTQFSKDNVVNNGTITGSVDLGSADDTLSNKGTMTGDIDLAEGNDRLENYGTIRGDILLGEGDDTFVHGIRATFDGTADGGNGSDTLLVDTAGGGTLDNSLFNQFVSFEVVSLIGDGPISAVGELPVETIAVNGGNLTVEAGQTLATAGGTAITGSSNGEAVRNQGTIIGNVDLGAGDDRFEAAAGSRVDGSIRGGDGRDTFAIGFAGGNDDPANVDLGNMEGFEVLEVAQGYGRVSGTLTFESINVAGGRLAGIAGSTINAGTVSVGQGATFGTAGTVNGNVDVAGTLSPGASPGTMVVNGDVTLASTSTTEFELSPEASDKLLVSGKLTIESGASLQLTGSYTLQPGDNYSLIETDGGIEGKFTTITKDDAIVGFVAQDANTVKLYGLIQAGETTTAQARNGINYVNATLQSGQASSALIGALPSLLDSNAAPSNSAFSQVTPEVYSSASQIGIEQGLALSRAARAQTVSVNGQGLYSFAQALGGWRNLDGRADVGTASADINTHGYLGGISYGFERGLRLGAFVGYADSKQSSGSGRTDVNGVVAGAFASASLDKLSLGATIVYNGGEAETKRRIDAVGAVARSEYDLTGWTADISARYQFALSEKWSLVPSAGVTYINSKRDSATETGADALSLDVNSKSVDAWFADAALGIHGSFQGANGMNWGVYANAGVRRILDIGASNATARFVGLTGDQMLAYGAERSRTSAIVNTGVRVGLSERVMLYASYSGDFAGKSNNNGINAGISVRF